MVLLPGRIEQQSRLRPGEIAVECGDRRVSYLELRTSAERIAARLRSLGVHTGDIVAVLADRDAFLPIMLAGVWKAGAAYLPLEPSIPSSRLEFMLRDSGAPVGDRRRPSQTT